MFSFFSFENQQIFLVHTVKYIDAYIYSIQYKHYTRIFKLQLSSARISTINQTFLGGLSYIRRNIIYEGGYGIFSCRDII